jgi:hypothetical protein
MIQTLEYQTPVPPRRKRWWLIAAAICVCTVALAMAVTFADAARHRTLITQAVAARAALAAQTITMATTRPDAAVAPPITLRDVPAPLFDDPIFHGAADPTLIWNPQAKLWFMYYTQRRATLEPAHGVDWCHGTAIGIATSPDGTHWSYKDICHGDQGLDTPVQSNCTWWAPSVYYTGDGVYHMFVVFVDGVYSSWKGKAFIKHFTSSDGLAWKYQDTLKLSSERCIDACVDKVGGQYRCWYKDERHGSHTWMASSDDLKTWTVDGEMVGDVGHEAPLYFHWKDRHFLIVDAGDDLRIYESPDGLSGWKFNSILLKEPGHRDKDNSNGKHPFVLVQGDRAFIYYFVHYLPKDAVYGIRRTDLQLAELKLDESGKVICDREQVRQ